MVKLLKSHNYLMDVDPVLVRSCLYLIPFDDLEDFAGQVNVELLDMLVVVLSKTPADITASSVTVREAGFLKGYKFERNLNLGLVIHRQCLLFWTTSTYVSLSATTGDFLFQSFPSVGNYVYLTNYL